MILYIRIHHLDADREKAHDVHTHPVDQRSTAFPWPFFVNTSGATYPKLPAIENSCSFSECKCLALSNDAHRQKISHVVNIGEQQTHIPKSQITRSESAAFVR